MDSLNVDIVIAAYNCEETLERAVLSAINQSDVEQAIYIVDDGSTDKTYAIAKKFDKEYECVHAFSRANGGAASARNYVIAKLKSDWYTYLDSDDELSPQWGREMHEFVVNNPGYDIYCSDGLFVFEDQNKNEPVFGYTKIHEIGLSDLLSECAILGGGALVKMDVVKHLNGYSEDLYGEDYDFWLRSISQGYRAIALPKKLYLYHQSISGRKSEDTQKGRDSAIVALNRVIEKQNLTNEQLEIANDFIARLSYMWFFEQQSGKYFSFFSHLFGVRMAGLIFRIIRPFTRMIRPLRIKYCQLRSRLTGRDEQK